MGKIAHRSVHRTKVVDDWVSFLYRERKREKEGERRKGRERDQSKKKGKTTQQEIL